MEEEKKQQVEEQAKKVENELGESVLMKKWNDPNEV